MPSEDRFFRTPPPINLEYHYDGHGILRAIQGPVGRVDNMQVLWALDDANALWLPTEERFGSSLVTLRGYDPMGRIRSIHTSDGGAIAQDLTYIYDQGGNIVERISDSSSLRSWSEHFGYDELNRLTGRSQCRTRDGFCRDQASRGSYQDRYRYDRLGNLTYKHDVGTYSYSSLRPFAVTRAGDHHFAYDGNGNQIQRDSISIQYGPANKPKYFYDTTTGLDVRLAYDGLQNRVRKTVAGALRTHYDGDDWERDVDGQGKLVQERIQVRVGNRVVAQLTQSDGSRFIEATYLHDDHQHSVDVVSNSGGIVESRSYTPFGEVDPAAISTTTSGFTGHEHDVNIDPSLVNMKGRMYDSKVGRFLSPDPIIQAPYFGQNYNRYSYVWNNPLRFVDPSGFQADVPDYSNGIVVRFDTSKIGDSIRHQWSRIKGAVSDRSSETSVRQDSLPGYAPMSDGYQAIMQELADPVTWIPVVGSMRDWRYNVGVAVPAGLDGHFVRAYAHIQLASISFGFAGLELFTVGRATLLTTPVKTVCKQVPAMATNTVALYSSTVGSRTAINHAVNHAVKKCFSGDTLVLMCDGTFKPIAELVEEDEVWARDEEGLEEGCREVLELHVTPGVPLVIVEIVDDIGQIRTLETTPSHPFWHVDSMEFRQAGELQPGDELLSHQGREIRVVDVRWAQESDTVYNLSVDGFRTYFVGEWGVWVHNVKTTSVPALPFHPTWSGQVQPYKKGQMSAIEHIIYRHGADSGWTNVGRFNEGTNARGVKSLVDEAATHGRLSFEGNGRGTIDHNFGRQIGTHSDGSPATKLRVHFDEAGKVTTAYPYK
ncbi:MAG: polymorphic toxin-type HINT domain-containing protein [Bradymonadaceae bacterium]